MRSAEQISEALTGPEAREVVRMMLYALAIHGHNDDDGALLQRVQTAGEIARDMTAAPSNPRDHASWLTEPVREIIRNLNDSGLTLSDIQRRLVAHIGREVAQNTIRQNKHTPEQRALLMAEAE